MHGALFSGPGNVKEPPKGPQERHRGATDSTFPANGFARKIHSLCYIARQQVPVKWVFVFEGEGSAMSAQIRTLCLEQPPALRLLEEVPCGSSQCCDKGLLHTHLSRAPCPATQQACSRAAAVRLTRWQRHKQTLGMHVKASSVKASFRV